MKTILNLNGRQSLAWVLLVVFCSGLFLPGYTYAGGGGPTQPESSSFTSIGTTGMVDPFTGNFSYNIPLMDVEGYPINIAYDANVSMDAEASWVGLGWNLNVGSVVRNMRGLPDDFNGEGVSHTTYMKPNRTISLDAGLGLELFGKGLKEKNDTLGDVAFTLNAGVGITYNNYNGFSSNFSFGPSFDFAKVSSAPLTAGFSLSGSSENGASFAPSVSFQGSVKDAKNNEINTKTTIGSAYNSRAGLSYLSFSRTMSRKANKEDGKLKNLENGESTISSGISGSYNLGLNHYSPQTGPVTTSLGLSGKLKGGGTIFGVDGSFDIGISYSSQWIPEDNITTLTPSYGYFYLQNGQKKPSSQLDFNRDDDGSFTKYTPFLPSTYLTYDLFSVMAQGTGGSFRGFRNEIGYVFDPENISTSASGSFGLESGFGNLTDISVDLSASYVQTSSGNWTGFTNGAANTVRFEQASPGLENFAMQNASESSVDTDPLAASLHGASAVYFPLSGHFRSVSIGNTLQDGGNEFDFTANNRHQRIKRNEVMQFLTHKQVTDGFGLDSLHPSAYTSSARDYHIGEITKLGVDGRRYVFGVAAYNHFQEDVTFATGETAIGEGGIAVTDNYSGVIDYLSYDPSPDNDFGIDNYYSSSITPAYTHSYLLTAVLSDDYVDSDTIKGPSDDDLGAYVHFEYEKVADYKWRTPMTAHEAFYNEGMKTDLKDDKGSFIYGEKDLWYTKAIVTKNYVAVFVLEDRDDGAAATGRNGGIDGAKRMKLLRRIVLFSKPDYEANGMNAVPLQSVHFEYDYSLCQGYPANTSATSGQQGKLTLKEIYFTYQGSGKMKRSSYTFEYGGLNPDYHIKAVDRWGNYKPTSSGLENPVSTVMNNADFPYSTQDQSDADSWAAPWSMTAINLPSGGRIEVEYESDDYAYVQHLKAMQMFPIVGTANSISDNDPDLTDYSVHSISDNGNKNQQIYFRMKPGHDNINDYMQKGRYLYFRCLVDFLDDLPSSSNHKYEYVSGYGMVVDLDTVRYQDSILLGRITLAGEKLKDSGSDDYSPISKFAIQFGRLHLSRYIRSAFSVAEDAGAEEQALLSFANSVIGAFSSFEELFDGPNIPIWEQNRGRNIVMNKSWIRLYEPGHRKLGGDHRVKRILTYDNWDEMTGDNTAGFSYGQEFHYTQPDGTSSGVATYEPMIGGDENPWHEPIPYDNKIRWGTDDKMYFEKPLMESQFPSPSVGYSRVVIHDLKRDGVTRTATGKVVKEFYTARDFPTIVRATDVDMKTANSFLPVLPKYQYMTVSQGFTIEMNDMHGKQKKESIYAEGVDDTPISTLEYFYQQQAMNLGGVTNFKLSNQVQTINGQGQTGTAEIGVHFESVADFRESRTLATSGQIALNTNSFLFGFVPVVIPIIWPSIDISENQFRSATMNKVVNRFGILEKVVANQDGSIIETNNLAYDANSGEVLVTQTTTDFNDKVYSMNYPAYWYYDQLGQAYRNIGVKVGDNIDFSSSGFTAIPNASNLFFEGDELAVTSASGSFSPVKGWVLAVVPSGITVVEKSGEPLTVQNATIEVIRSGRRNKQMTSMASIATLNNPVNALSTNGYANVLAAGAVEFGQDWKTYCDCFKDSLGEPLVVNPYVIGTKGNWRPIKSYTHLSGRTQSDFDNNTNIRRDGVFTSYTPYYRMVNGTWQKNPLNWTFVSEVTAFSPNGMALETRDALGRYSANLYGYNNTFATAVSVNTKLEQLAFHSFEDVDYTNCMDNHMPLETAGNIIPDGHTGRNSLRVTSAEPIVFTLGEPDCAEAGCDLELVDESPHLFIITNGTLPYTVEAEVITGGVDVSVTNHNLLSIQGAVGDYYEIRVTITDANGCQLIQTIQNTEL